MIECIETYREIDGVLVVTLTGEINVQCSLEIFQWIKGEFLEKGYSKIIFDFSKVSGIDSLGLGILVSVYKNAISNKGNIVLVNPNENVFKLLQITGLIKIFKITDSVPEALKIFK